MHKGSYIILFERGTISECSNHTTHVNYNESALMTIL